MSNLKNDRLDETSDSQSDSSLVKVKELTDEDIVEQGSLALLAMGYEGIMLWRQKVYGKNVLQKQPS